jgi:capsid portal protein
MEIKRLYKKAIAEAKTALENAERVQGNQLKLKPEDYNKPQDYEQDRQENAHNVYQHSIYLQQLEALGYNLQKLGINIK